MPEIASTAFDMISGMTPVMRSGVYVFISTNDSAVIASLLPRSLATFHEVEGMSMLVTVDLAKEFNFNAEQPMRCITLNVYSSLEGVGLTAAVSVALADNAIPCNMIAGHHHDHVFVPLGMCDQAIYVLKSLQKQTIE